MPRATPKPSGRLTRSRESKGPAWSQSREADELMALAVDAAQSRHLPGFLERFAERAARMLNANWGGVMVFRGRETDLYQANSRENLLEPSRHSALVRLAREHRREVEVRLLATDSGFDAQPEHPGVAVILVPITASDEESLGSVCLLRDRATLEKSVRSLLPALASHAALSLENFRRFSQLERSKRQWVEDIDAISDYIVVHDRAWKIVRTNWLLASHLCVLSVAPTRETITSRAWRAAGWTNP